MAPFAASYRPPEATSSEPVLLTLGTGPQNDTLEYMMDVEEIDTKAVLAAVGALREVAMDVDEQPWNETAYTGPSEDIVAVLDTNILLRHLTLLQQVVHRLEAERGPHPTLLIPHIVITELDGLKNSPRYATQHGTETGIGIATLSRRASAWLLDATSTSHAHITRAVRGQRRGESLVEDQQKHESNDGRVLDAALYHKKMGKHAILLTDDKNLCFTARAEGLVSFSLEDKMDPAQLIRRLLPERPQRDRPKITPQKSKHAPAQDYAPTPSRARSNGHGPENGHSQNNTAAQRSIEETMEVEPDFVPTPVPAPAGPETGLAQHPVEKPSDVYLNMGIVIGMFLSARVYAHIFGHLERTRPKEKAVWQADLGDWRKWEGVDCIAALKKYWDTGDISNVCLKGLEQETRSSRPVLGASSSSHAASRQASPPATAVAQTRSSRWDTHAPSTRSYQQPQPRAPPAINGHTKNLRLPAAKRLSNLRSALPILITALSVASPEETNKWSAPRWEVLVEGIGECLMAILGGLCGDVEDAVRAVQEEWAEQLRSVGVKIELEPLTG